MNELPSILMNDLMSVPLNVACWIPPPNATLFACFLRRLSASLIVARLSYRSIIFPLSTGAHIVVIEHPMDSKPLGCSQHLLKLETLLIPPKRLDFTKLLIPDAVG